MKMDHLSDSTGNSGNLPQTHPVADSRHSFNFLLWDRYSLYTACFFMYTFSLAFLTLMLLNCIVCMQDVLLRTGLLSDSMVKAGNVPGNQQQRRKSNLLPLPPQPTFNLAPARLINGRFSFFLQLIKNLVCCLSDRFLPFSC